MFGHSFSSKITFGSSREITFKDKPELEKILLKNTPIPRLSKGKFS